MTAVDRCLLDVSRALGDAAVVTDRAAREAHAGDESECAPVVPDAVVHARSTGDVATTLRLASEHLVPVTPRAAGTGKSGGCIPARGGIVLAMGAMSGIDEIHREAIRWRWCGRAPCSST